MILIEVDVPDRDALDTASFLLHMHKRQVAWNLP
jgi:hypothetical protein